MLIAELAFQISAYCWAKFFLCKGISALLSTIQLHSFVWAPFFPFFNIMIETLLVRLVCLIHDLICYVSTLAMIKFISSRLILDSPLKFEWRDYIYMGRLLNKIKFIVIFVYEKDQCLIYYTNFYTLISQWLIFKWIIFSLTFFININV